MNTFSKFKKPSIFRKSLVLFFSLGLLYSCKNTENESTDMDMEEEIDTSETAEMENDNEYPDNSVADFITYVESEGDYEEATEEPNPYESTRKFAAAVNERARIVKSSPEDLDEIEDMENETDSVAGDDLKQELDNIVDALKEMQETAYSEMNEEVDELRAELDEIYEDEVSNSELNAFFLKAANVLGEMDEPLDGTMETNPGAVDHSTEADTIETEQ